MAVTSSNGIITTSGGGNLDIQSLYLSGEGTPITPPIDVLQTWLYQDTLTGTTFKWDIPNEVWVQIEEYGVLSGTTVLAENHTQLSLVRTASPNALIPIALPHAGFRVIPDYSIPDCTTLAPLPIDSLGQRGDYLLFWDALQPNRLTVPVGGVYLVTAWVEFTSLTTSSWEDANIWFRLVKYGGVSRQIATATCGAGEHSRNSITISGHTRCSDNSYITFEVYNWAGGGMPKSICGITINNSSIEISRLV